MKNKVYIICLLLLLPRICYSEVFFKTGNISLESIGAAESGANTSITSADNLRLIVGTSTYGKPIYLGDIQGTRQTVTGTTSAVTVYSKTLKAGTLGTSSALRILTLQSLISGNTDITASVLLGGTQIMYYGQSGSAPLTMENFGIFCNRGSTTSQIGYKMGVPPFKETTDTMTTSIDTSIDQTLSVTLQNGSTTPTSALELIMVEVINP